MNKLKLLMGACSVLTILLLAKLSLADPNLQSLEIQPVAQSREIVNPYPAVQAELVQENMNAAADETPALEDSFAR